MTLESYFYLWLGSYCLYLNVARQSMLADQTSNIWKMLRSKSMSRSQYLHSLCKVFVSVLSGGNVLILFLKQVGGRNTVLERAFVRNGVPFVSEVPIIIFGADVTHLPPGEDSPSSICVERGTMQLCSLHPCCGSR